MTRHLTLDFVWDVACPWCAVGFLELEEALRRIAADASKASPGDPAPHHAP